jgi:hypothetical protein
MPGLGRGPPERGGIPPGAGPGRGACGRGAGAPEPTPNGLFPTLGPGRGACGRGACGRGACGRGAWGRGAGTSGPGGATGGPGLAATAGSGSTTAGAGATAAASTAGAGAGASAAGGAAFFAGAFFAAAGFSAGSDGNASRSLRATGASTVDDALLTNSPSSLSFARTSLLVTPSSFASSCTRALPATGLLRRTGRASRSIPARRGWYSSLALHRVPIALLLPVGGTHFLLCGRLFGNVLANRRRIERTNHAEGSRERPASLGERHAPRIAMQPCTAAGGAAARVRHHKRALRLAGERA